MSQKGLDYVAAAAFSLGLRLSALPSVVAFLIYLFSVLHGRRLDMCRRQYANDVCNRGTAGRVDKRTIKKACPMARSLFSLTRGDPSSIISLYKEPIIYLYIIIKVHTCTAHSAKSSPRSTLPSPY